MDKEAAAGRQDKQFVVPVAREELHVGTRRVDTGRGVRVRKTVNEQAHRIDQVLLHDALDVKRIAVDRVVPLNEAPVTRQEGDTLIVPVLEEILVVEKRLRIKEEIHIIRSTQQERYAGTAVLRAEQVSVERFDDSSGTDATSTDGGSHHATNSRSRL